MADNTVFDSVFKTMIKKAPHLLIPFINETFGRDYPQDAQITSFSSEHASIRGTIIDDAVFRLQDKIYHVECQSTPDANMVVRMIEYDFAIALEEAIAAGAPYEMDFPASCVLFLRHTPSTPDVLRMKVNLPDGGSFEYKTKVVKAQLISSNELFEKRLLLLLPYYLMRYENAIAQIANDDSRTAQLVAECSDLRANLESMTVETGDTKLYEELVELIIKVSDHLFAAYGILQKKVRRAMGGEVLELLHDRAERLEREGVARGIEIGIQQGIEQGIEQGIQQGIEQGIEQGIQQGIEQGIEQGRAEGRAQGFDELADALKERGFDAAAIDEVIASLATKAE